MTRNKQLALYGILSATIFASMYLDRILSAYLPVSVAVMTLVVALTFCLINERFVISVVSGLVFGISSFVVAFTMPNFTTPLFINPLISVLPRVLMGISVFAVYGLCRKIIKGSKATVIILSISACSGALFNTLYTLSAIAIFGDKSIATAVLGSLLAINVIVEALLSTILVPTVIIAVRKGIKWRAEN